MDSGSLARILRNISEASSHRPARRALSPSIAIDVWDAYHTKLRFFTTEDTGDTEINFKITQSIVEAVARVKLQHVSESIFEERERLSMPFVIQCISKSNEATEIDNY
jgi:hypothetical protein